MYLNKKQLKAIKSAIYIMGTTLENYAIPEEYEDISESLDTLIEMAERAEKEKISIRRKVKMKDAKVYKYQMGFPALSKKLQEENRDAYDKLVIHIRLDELQGRSSRMVRIGKPTFGGTNITFQSIENKADYNQEMESIIRDGEALGMKFEKVSI